MWYSEFLYTKNFDFEKPDRGEPGFNAMEIDRNWAELNH